MIAKDVAKILLLKRLGFIESIDVVVRHSGESLEGEVNFSCSFVDSKKILVFVEGDECVAVKNLGVNLVGASDLVTSIRGNKSVIKSIAYCVGSSEMLPEIKKIARILSSAGVMPTVKNGMIVDDVSTMVKRVIDGRAWFRSTKDKIIYMKIANTSFDSEVIVDNFLCLMRAIIRSGIDVKRSIRSIYIKSTMGKAVSCDVSSIIGGL